MCGPLEALPFPAARVCRLSLVPKDKWSPQDLSFRLISDFSSFGASSVNSLSWSPLLISGGYARACHLRDRVARAGRGAWLAGCDVPKAFRRQPAPTSWLPFLVYVVRELIYVDLCHPFGLRASEYSWQAILAVLMWRLHHTLDPSRDGPPPLAMVDNFYVVHRSESGARAVLGKIQAMCSSVGLPLHEVHVGRSMTSLGWLFDTSAMTMSVTPAKLAIIKSLLTDWKDRAERGGDFSVRELRKVCGLLLFLADGCEPSRPYLAALIAERNRCESSSGHSVVLRPAAVASVAATHALFVNWRGSAPVVESFSPRSFAQVLGYVDASKLHGCGGIMLDVAPATYLPTGQVFGFAKSWSQREFIEAKQLDDASTALLELWGIERWLTCFGRACAGKRLVLLCDNEAAIVGVTKAYSSAEHLASVILRIRVLLAQFNIVARLRFLPTQCNLVADALSHLRLSEATSICNEWFGRTLVMAA